MKKWKISLGGILVVAFAVATISPSPKASSPQYAVTNNNVSSTGANSATILQHTGPLLQMRGTLSTGGTGASGGGFDMMPLQAIVHVGSNICVYISDANGQGSDSNDIVAFNKTAKVGVYTNSLAGPSPMGVGLAATPSGTILYAAYTNASVGVWTINSDCSLTMSNVVRVFDVIGGMRVSPDGKTLVVSFPEAPNSVNSFQISGLTLAWIGPFKTNNPAAGVDVTADSKYALVAEQGAANTAEVEVFPINSNSSLGTGTDFTFSNAGDEPGSIWLSPDGKLAFMGVTSSNSPTGITVTSLNFNESALSLTLNCLVKLNNPNNEIQFAGQVATLTATGHGGALYVTEVGTPSAMGFLQIPSSGCPFEIPGSPFTNSAGQWPWSVSAFPPRPY